MAIPITFDQPGVAARIAAKKTGVTIPFEKLTSEGLSTLLGEVLNNGVYRENARKFQDAIARTNGLSMAADLVVQALGVGKENAPSTGLPVRSEQRGKKVKSPGPRVGSPRSVATAHSKK